MTVPSVGDIVMLSQVAWRIGRAFTAGRKNAPPELQAVEVDISGLAQALKQLAETLHTSVDSNLISKSSQETQDGLAIIISSCQRTLHDLDSLLDRYQVIRKHRTPGGFAIERSWSDLILAQYETVIWTTEGGSLHDLSSLLQMHTKSTLLLAEAVQSGSMSQLEMTVTPMAKRFDSMYDLPGSLEEQLEEVSRFVQELALAAPSTQAPPVPQRNPARSPMAEISDPLSTTSIPILPPALSPRRTSTKVLSSSPQQRSVSTASSTSKSAGNDTSTSAAGDPFISTHDTPRKHVSDFSFGGSSSRDSTSSYASSTSSAVSRGSLKSRNTLISVTESVPLNWSPQLSGSVQPHTSSSTLLPPPTTRPTSAQSAPDIGSVLSNSTLSPFPVRQDSITKLHRSSTTASQKAAFEKDAFRNSAVLCDVPGTLVEYSQKLQPDPDSPGDMADIEMVPACEACRIAVVRKRVTDPETRRVQVKTSIWALSNDNTVRVEVPLSSDDQYIPYASFFDPTKISITVPCELYFHDVKYGNRLLRTNRSSWVNFLFTTPSDATLFQNETMGRTLLATFRTTKTLRIHEGTLASFAYQEQMCALENLRIWEDEKGCVVGLIHFSASFREGWLAFCINDREILVEVKDAGGREVKIRGLRVPILDAGRALRKDSAIDAGAEVGDVSPGRKDVSGDTASIAEAMRERRSSTAGFQKDKGKTKTKTKVKTKTMDRKKIISGARIEFATEAEKTEFLELVNEYQAPGRLCDGPDLVGGE